MKIYDCFTFFNELDLLEIRLNVLNDVVDYFVLVEASTTFQNAPKPLYFMENKQRYEKFLHKIIHIVVDDIPNSPEPFENEYYQRNAISRGLVDCKPEDKIIISDVDEIPNPEAVKFALNQQSPILFNQKLFYYYLNNLCLDFENFPCSSMIDFSMFTTAQGLRDKVIKYHSLQLSNGYVDNTDFIVLNDGGWHFSCLGGVDAIITKLESFAHSEYNTPEYKDPQRISNLINSGQDLIGRELTFKLISVDQSYPLYIFNNMQRFQYLINSNLSTDASKNYQVKCECYSDLNECKEMNLYYSSSSQFSSEKIFVSKYDDSNFCVNFLLDKPITNVRSLMFNPTNLIVEINLISFIIDEIEYINELKPIGQFFTLDGLEFFGNNFNFLLNFVDEREISEIKIIFKNFNLIHNENEKIIKIKNKIIEKFEKKIIDQQNELFCLSDWATSINKQLNDKNHALVKIHSNFWYRVLKMLRLIK